MPLDAKGILKALLADSIAEKLAATDVRTVISEETLQLIIERKPFIASNSVANLRDTGAILGSTIPAGRVYRCGTLVNVAKDPKTEEWLRANVRHIYDLRAEHDRTPDPVIQGVENVWHPTQDNYPAPDLDKFAYRNGIEAWKTQFLNIALSLRPTFKAVLKQVRHQPQEPMLIHCDAGRDRTDVLSNLLHHLAGSDPETAFHDYMLSRIGLEPIREEHEKYIMEKFKIQDRETPGFWNLVGLRHEYCQALVDALNERFGGWDGYVTAPDGLNISEKDLEVIKVNMRTEFPRGK